MTRKKIVVKETERKDDLDPSKDEFVTNSMSFLDWAVERRRQIGVIIATILVASVAGILYANYRNNAEAESSRKLATGLDAWTAPLIRTADESGVPSEKNDKLLSFETREARATESLSRIEKASTDLSGASLQTLSLVKASALIDKGDLAGAEAVFRGYLDSGVESGKWLEANAIQGLATVLSAAGKKDEAAKTADRLKSVAQGRVGKWAELERARVEINDGKIEPAKTRLSGILAFLATEGEPDALDYLFVEARALLLSIDPSAKVADVPSGISPEILQQLLQMRQAGGGALQ